MQYVLPVPPAMFQLCGGDVFMSDFKGLNIFSKSWLWVFILLCVFFFFLNDHLLVCEEILHISREQCYSVQ